MVNKLSVAELFKKFPFEVLHKHKPEETYIRNSGVSRIGIDLATPYKHVINWEYSGAICLGLSELNFFKNLTQKEITKKMDIIKQLNPPLLILNRSWGEADRKRIVKEMGKDTTVNIAFLNMSSQDIYYVLSPYIAKKISPTLTLHGTLLSVFGVGTLITGDSGIGKSETAMELIKTGHLFVADDAVEIYNFGQQIYGRSSQIAKHYIEVRGLGILNVARMFGKQVTLRETPIQVVVELVSPDNGKNQLNKFERIGHTQRYEEIAGAKIAKYYIPIQAGRSVSNMIESAVIDYKLKQGGYNSGDEYLANYNKILEKNSKK